MNTKLPNHPRIQPKPGRYYVSPVSGNAFKYYISEEGCLAFDVWRPSDKIWACNYRSLGPLKNSREVTREEALRHTLTYNSETPE